MRNTFLQQINDALESNDLSIPDFKKEKSSHSTKIIFKEEPRLYFIFHESDDSHLEFTFEYTKFDKKFPPVEGDEFGGSFEETMKEFNTWLDEVAGFLEENETGDPWDDWEDDDDDDGPLLLSESLSNIDFNEDAPFTGPERKLLKEDLSNAYEHIRDNFDIAPDRLNGIESAIRDLSDKIDHLSKNSWKDTARDILKDVIIDAAKDQFSLKALLGLFKNLFDDGVSYLSDNLDSIL